MQGGLPLTACISTLTVARRGNYEGHPRGLASSAGPIRILGDAAPLLEEKCFDIILADFDDSHAAAQVIENVRHSASKNAIAVGLLSDPSQVRSAFGQGANFVLYKPVKNEQALASLRAAIALLKSERRRKFRVPVQLSVTLSWQDAPEVEGIMLDVSEDGMDVLSAQPLQGSRNDEVDC